AATGGGGGGPPAGRFAGGRSQRRLSTAGAGAAERMERGARIGEARGQGGGKLIAALPQEVEGADSQATAGGSAAGARPAATKPKAAINAASKAARISDVSPMSGPCRNDTRALRWCTAISAAKCLHSAGLCRASPNLLLSGHLALFCPYQ